MAQMEASSRPILIVEDDEGLSYLMQKQLQQSGLKAEVAFNGTQAIEWISQHPQSLMVVDYHLPDMSASDMVGVLQEKEARFSFIVTTGYGDEKIAVEMMKLGACDYIVKDAGFLDLLPVVITKALEQLGTETNLLHARQELLDKELRFRRTVEQSGLGTLLANSEGIVLEWDRNQEHITGKKAQDALGKPIWNVLSSLSIQPINVDKIRSAIEELFQNRESGKQYTLELELKDRHFHFVQNVFYCVESDSMIMLGGITRDITNEKHIQDALFESERKYRMLFNTMLDGFSLYQIIYDGAKKPVDYRFLEVNPAFERLTGLKARNVLGKTLREVLPDLESFWYETYKRAIITGEAIHAVNFLRPFNRYYEVTAFCPQKGFLALNFVDVTEQKRAESKVQTQIERLAALHEIDLSISTGLDLRSTLDILLVQVTRQLQVDAADLILLNPQGKKLEIAASYGLESVPGGNVYLNTDEVIGKIIQENQAVFISDLRQENTLRQARDLTAQGFVSYYGLPLVIKGAPRGSLEVFHRSPLQPGDEWLSFLNALAIQAGIAIDSAQMFENLQQHNQALSQAYEQTIEGWAMALELRDMETQGHSKRVTQLAVKLAQALGLPQGEVEYLKRGALLHDIGKMGIPDSILNKPGALSEAEWEIMRQHPVYAHRFLSHIQFLGSGLAVPYSHHEKWDGTGYPLGLKGDEIPLLARIFSIVDVWDALHTERAYRKAWARQQIIDYIRGLSGVEFDPAIVEVFLSLVSEDYQSEHLG